MPFIIQIIEDVYKTKYLLLVPGVLKAFSPSKFVFSSLTVALKVSHDALPLQITGHSAIFHKIIL